MPNEYSRPKHAYAPRDIARFAPRPAAPETQPSETRTAACSHALRGASVLANAAHSPRCLGRPDKDGGPRDNTRNLHLPQSNQANLTIQRPTLLQDGASQMVLSMVSGHDGRNDVPTETTRLGTGKRGRRVGQTEGWGSDSFMDPPTGKSCSAQFCVRVVRGVHAILGGGRPLKWICVLLRPSPTPR